MNDHKGRYLTWIGWCVYLSLVLIPLGALFLDCPAGHGLYPRLPFAGLRVRRVLRYGDLPRYWGPAVGLDQLYELYPCDLQAFLRQEPHGWQRHTISIAILQSWDGATARLLPPGTHAVYVNRQPQGDWILDPNTWRLYLVTSVQINTL